MSPEALQALRSRIRRAQQAARKPRAEGYEQEHTLEDGTTHQYSIVGIKSPEQLEDELLALFVWVWSLKDYLKAVYKTRGLDPSFVERVVNESRALQYVADIANRAKHGVLRTSRSGAFAELIDVGFTVPQSSIAKITVGAFAVGMDITNLDDVELLAFVKANEGEAADAFTVLAEALAAWETHVISRIAP